MPTREKRAKQLGISIDELPDGRGRHGRHARGEQHYRWNSDRILSDDGYAKVRVGTDHPLADPNGYAYEHLVVWASAGRRLPDDNELLHHKSEERTDNRLSNLELMKRSDHNAHHVAARARDAAGRLLPIEHKAFPPQLVTR